MVSPVREKLGILAVLFVLSSCGGGGSDGETAGGESSGDEPAASEAAASGLAAAECQSFGFTGTASRIADDGFAQVAGEYTGDDLVDAVSEGGNWFKLVAASYPLATGDAGSTPDVPAGGVAVRFDFAEGTTGATGDLGWGNPGLPPLVSNGGSGTNQNDTEGTYRVIEAASDAICVDVAYTDSHQAINGVFVARFSE